MTEETGKGPSGGDSRARIRVAGRVQGVGYRGFAQRHALALGLRGWAKNHYDGTVEVMVEGERHRIERYVSLLREGPPWARVEDVEVEWQEYLAEFASFQIRGW